MEQAMNISFMVELILDIEDVKDLIPTYDLCRFQLHKSCRH